jgi:patatin-related protein
MRPVIRYEQEIRFAVVMYGGVSLAVYINGIAQELLRMVRATAAGEADEAGERRALLDTSELRGSEVAYRQAAQLLSHRWDGSGASSSATPLPDAPIRTRFVVDVLSGTSAGGINAIYLAKALANEQDLDLLKTLWIREGDIGLLINDAGSVRDIAPLPADSPPRSLLNGRRMYRKLLDAFRGMDDTPAVRRSRLADEIDLYITTTDVRGNPVPLQLADKVVYERRYRNAFHFRYDGGAGGAGGAGGDVDAARNDFRSSRNPLLAFAARCTSSFPFAFEPVTLPQVESVLALFPRAGEEPLSEEALAGAFGAAAVQSGGASGSGSPVAVQSGGSTGSGSPVAVPGARAADALPYRDRVYVDGGYLDNKPFGYAIDALGGRSAELPVKRRLLYVEPAPEQLELKPRASNPPNALQNAGAALVTIPGYETIREDLQRVLARNRLVERVWRVTSGTETDLGHWSDATADRESALADHSEPHTAAFADEDLRSMIARFGVAYGGYHRLKVAEQTDRIAEWFAAAAGLDPASDHVHAVRYLVRAWRDAHYTHYFDAKGDVAEVDRDGAARDARQSFNRFLMDYDHAYRVRRVRSVMARVGMLERGGEPAERVLRDAGITKEGELEDEAATCRAAGRLRNGLSTVLDGLLRTTTRLDPALAAATLRGDGTVRGSDATMRGGDATVQGGDDLGSLAAFIADARIDADALHALLEEPAEAERMACARGILGLSDGAPPAGWTAADAARANAALGGAAAWLQRQIATSSIAASTAVAALLEVRASDDAATAEARRAVRYFYDRFEAYDMVEYPTLYASGAGEERDEVEVVRISPIDAIALYDPARRGGEGKLAGTGLHNFGAFLDVRWRRNDMLWGRLDGAERILAALLPGRHFASTRDALTRRAQTAVLAEELGGPDREAVTGLVAQITAAAGPGALRPEVRKALFPDGRTPDAAAMLNMLRGLASDDALYRYFREAYTLDRTLDRTAMTRSAARGTRVIGEMLGDMAEPGSPRAAHGAFMARVGRMIWSFVEVSVPDSPARTIVRHLGAVFFLFAMLVAGAGIVLNDRGVLGLGVASLVVVGVMAGGSALLSDYLRGGRGARVVGRLAVTTALGLLLYFATIGALMTFRMEAAVGGVHLPTAIGLAAAVVIAGTLLRDVADLGGGLLHRLRGVPRWIAARRPGAAQAAERRRRATTG